MTLRQSACALQDETGERNGCETWALDTMGSSGVPRNFFGGEGVVQKIQLKTEDRENGDLGEVAP